MDITILVATHKSYWMPKDSVYVPIQVGKAGKKSLGYLTDDTGNNISTKNDNYCELTAMYWAWKNLQCDYIGLCHYRRYFGYDMYCQDVKKIKTTIFTRSDYENLLDKHDIILPTISKIGNKLTVREEYERAHFGKDLKQIEYIVKKLYPEYKESMENVLNSRYIHYFNMFVMRKNLFDSYCQWLFSILFELEVAIDITSYDSYQKRVFGFLSERLFNVWLDKNKLNIIEASVVSLEPEKPHIWKKCDMHYVDYIKGVKMEEEKVSQFYHSDKRFEVAIAICIGMGVCLTRLATAVSQIFLVAATILGIYLWWKNGRNLEINRSAKKYIKITYIFFFATLISIVDADNKLAVFQIFFDTWIWRFMVFVLIVSFIKKKKYLLNILIGFFCIFSLDCFTACYQFFILHWQRGRGFHGDYLDLTAIICMVLAMSAIILLDDSFEKRMKRFAMLGLFSSILGLFGCFGRGAFLVSALVAPFYLYYYLKNSKKIAIIILAILCLLGGIVMSSPKYVARLSTTFNTTTNRSNVDRIWTWRSSIDMYLDHPINGVGFNNWNWYYKNEGYKYSEETQNLPHAHSNYMQLLAETGSIGFLGFIYFYGYSLIIPFKRWIAEHNPCDLIFFAAFLASMVFFGVFQPTYRLSSVIRTMWFILALMIQLHDIYDGCTIKKNE